MSFLFLLFSFTSFAQLENLNALSNKKLIAIGESGHAVAEYHNWRGHISKRLIEKHGFRNVLVEEEILAGLKISDAIDSCRSADVDMRNVTKAFLNFYPTTYRHQEFFNFYQYLCEWNKKHPKDPVRLSGIDIWSDASQIRTFLEQNLSDSTVPEVTQNLQKASNYCFLWSLKPDEDYRSHPDWIYYGRYKVIEPNRNAECLAAITALNLALSKIPEISPKLLMVLDTGLTLQKLTDAYHFDFPKAMALRDAAQARNVLSHLKIFQSKAPTIFLAHNVHVFKKMSQVLPREISTPYPWANVPSAGEWLKAHYGEQMAIIAMGGYDIKSLRDGQYPIPTSDRSLDLKLHKQGLKTALIKAPKGEWWVHNETEQEGLWIKPLEQFDYYFFIDQSGPATKFESPLVTGKTQKPKVLH